MRRAHISAVIAVALGLLTAGAAQADIAPVPKPDGPAKTVTPLEKPPTGTTQQPQPPPAKTPVQPTQPVRHETTHTPATHVTSTSTTSTAATPPPPAAAVGGRVQPTATLVPTPRHKAITSQIAELFPTHLASVGKDSLPSYDTWPPWVLGAFTLLASAEAFLLVRLARARQFRREELRELAER